MILVVDANIIFSSILKPKSQIASILLDSANSFIFIAPSFLKREIRKHEKRLSQLTGLTNENLNEIMDLIFSRIHFYDDEILPDFILNNSDSIAKDIDLKDSIYIAFALFFNCKIWTGDMQLHRGLREKNYDFTITTNELPTISISKFP